MVVMEIAGKITNWGLREYLVLLSMESLCDGLEDDHQSDDHLVIRAGEG